MKAMKWFKGGNSLKKDEHHGEDQEKVTVVFGVYMHCPSCANEIKKLCKKTKGVEVVEIDKEKSQATVKGNFDVEKLKKRFWNKAQKVVTVISVDKQGKNSTPSEPNP